jgi:OOP family OmpA-OmpF porin
MRRLPLILAVVSILYGCAKPWPDVQPLSVSPLGLSEREWRVTDHVVIVTDASATMTRDALLPEARALAGSFIAGMPEPDARPKRAAGYKVSLIGFGGDERLATAHAAVERSDASREDGPLHRDELAGTAASLSPLGSLPMGGNTPLDAVLAEAGASLEGERGRAAVIVISDGRADNAAAALEAGRALVSGHPDELCIHTVQVGGSAEGRSLLEKLAALSSCGSARQASSASSVAALQGFERDVFVAAAELPPVAARGTDPCERRLVLRGVRFDFDRATLRPESTPVLDTAVDQLSQCSDVSLSIEGHTCSIGTEGYNQGLSERRAQSVRQYLIEHGISADRLRARGRGEGAPVATNDSRDGRAQNRRVELTPAP